MIKTKDVVEIPNCGLYAKSPEALAALLEELKEVGYDINDCGAEEKRASREEMEKNGWSLWLARLRDDVCGRKGKCRSCKSYIDVRGVRSHKHKCEICGAHTYLEFVDGSTISFYFMNDASGERGFLSSDIKMKVYDYDEQLGCLLLYPKPLDGGRWGTMDSKRAQKVLDANRKQFRRIPSRLSKGMRKHIRRLKAQSRYDEVKDIQSREKNRRFGKSLIAIPYELHMVGVINTTDSYGHVFNHDVVKLFQGQEYSDWGNLPIPESYSIYEAWHWAPVKPSYKLHEKIIGAAGMVSRCDYYYQDDRPEFYDIHLKRMRLFVEHFTTINIDEWDSMICRAPKSGPGMIRTIASFCQGVEPEVAKVTNKPNAFGAIAVLADAFSGRGVTDNGFAAIADAMKDPDESKLLFDALGGGRK